jgi:hypothetical protein
MSIAAALRELSDTDLSLIEQRSPTIANVVPCFERVLREAVRGERQRRLGRIPRPLDLYPMLENDDEFEDPKVAEHVGAVLTRGGSDQAIGYLLYTITLAVDTTLELLQAREDAQERGAPDPCH